MQVDARERLVIEAEAWLNTPYHPHARLKGIGVDCAQLLIGVYAAAGVIDEFDTGFYPQHWHLHRNEELFLDWIKRVGGRPIESPRRGDVAVFRFGRTFSHGAVMASPDEAIHAYINVGVVRTRMNEEPLVSRPVQFWSLLE